MRVATVESQTVATVAYDAARELLQLEFCSRAVYLYLGVPQAVHRALLEAPSKGRFFNQTIRGRFSYRRIPALMIAPEHAEVASGCDQ